MLCVKLQDRVDAQQVATFTFEENLITSRDYSQIQTIKHTASREEQAEFLLGILSHGDNTTFDIFLSILHNKMKTQVYQGLAKEMNDAANSLIPGTLMKLLLRICIVMVPLWHIGVLY